MSAGFFGLSDSTFWIAEFLLLGPIFSCNRKWCLWPEVMSLTRNDIIEANCMWEVFSVSDLNTMYREKSTLCIQGACTPLSCSADYTLGTSTAQADTLPKLHSGRSSSKVLRPPPLKYCIANRVQGATFVMKQRTFGGHLLSLALTCHIVSQIC